jgi:hypothetical protein
MEEGVMTVSPMRSRSRPATGASRTGGRTSPWVPSWKALTHLTSGNRRMTWRMDRKMPTARTNRIIELMNGLAQKKVSRVGRRMSATSPTRTRKIKILTR